MKMKDYYITQLKIHKVRHLKNITIPVSDAESACHNLKHLIITGKNGSGKTSVLDSISRYLFDICGENQFFKAKKELAKDQINLQNQMVNGANADLIHETRERMDFWGDLIDKNDSGIDAEFNVNVAELNAAFKDNEFIMAFFGADRAMQADVPKHVEKIVLKSTYSIFDTPSKDFIKYLTDKKVSESLYQTKGEIEKSEQIAEWFNGFESILRKIYEDPYLTLDFDIDTFAFHIHAKDREQFDFNTMSAGYAAILEIVVNILMRMEHQTNGRFAFTMPGIVLIDELETHLHYELQKNVLPFLCGFFPNIQFIISTHSAFILNSISNAVIYDLENQTLVRDGLADYPYEGIIEGYFDVSTLSDDLQRKFGRYRELVKKDVLTPSERTEIKKLSLYLEEIPDYLALNITTEYRRLKLEYEQRGDLDG